jgi:hypothetical protein
MSNKYTFKAVQGNTFNRTFNVTLNGSPWNLSGYTGRMQVRPTVESSKVLLNLNTENGGIVLGGGAGSVSLYASATTMAGIIAGDHVYDIELVSGGGEVTTILKGKFAVAQEVTR